MPTPLEPQAALETAVLDLMQAAAGSGGLGWTALQCGRTFDAQPPPLARCPWFAAVWHDGSRRSAMVTALDEEFSLTVTITAELPQPFDRWVLHRDLLEAKANDVRALIHKDVYSNAIVNAANTLADYRRADLASGATQHAGFYRGLAFTGMDAIVEAGADWLHARDPNSERCCIYQHLRFGGAKRTQDLGDAE